MKSVSGQSLWFVAVSLAGTESRAELGAFLASQPASQSAGVSRSLAGCILAQSGRLHSATVWQVAFCQAAFRLAVFWLAVFWHSLAGCILAGFPAGCILTGCKLISPWVSLPTTFAAPSACKRPLDSVSTASQQIAIVIGIAVAIVVTATSGEPSAWRSRFCLTKNT